jgi:GR25 family glycosyltransferase involved in LPS biosynthesis
MKAYAITLDGNTTSEAAAEELIRSSHHVGNDFVVVPFHAVRPENAEKDLRSEGLTWTYPWAQPKIDLASGLTLSPYRTADKRKRIGCFMSHYKLWQECEKLQEDILILEHDALFTNRLEYDIMNNNYGIIGINDPRGATRKSVLYHTMIQESRYPVQSVPRIDVDMVPQGLAGNSAYIIKPWAATEVIKRVKQLGAWPNDAMLCYQNFRANFLGVTKKYYTKVQGLPSTTTL